MEGVAGGELRGGRQLREVWGFGLRWFPDAAEGLGGSARSRGGGWWCYTDGGGGLWLRLNGPEGGGGCTGRRWGRRPSLVDCLLWGC